MGIVYRGGSPQVQSAKLTAGPMPEASRFDAGPEELSYPLARLASENLRTEN